MNRFIIAAAACVFAGCGTNSVRQVEGRLANSLNTGVIVVAEGLDGSQNTAVPSADGLFRLSVKVNTATRLSLATPGAAGSFLRTRRIGPDWFSVGPGQTLNLGEVREAGTVASGAQTTGGEHVCASTSGHSEDDADDDDHRDGGDDSGHHSSDDGEGDDDHHGDDHDGDHHSDAGDDSHHDGDDDSNRGPGMADGGSRSRDRDGDDDCEHVKVEGCSRERLECDHDDEMKSAAGPEDSCGADGGTVVVDPQPPVVNDAGIF